MAEPRGPFQVKSSLCLNGQAIPVETKDMILLDPLNLADSNSLDLPESTVVNLISFKASGDMNWLCKSLQVPGGDDKKCKKCRWWVHNSVRVPLLMEIKEAIKHLKKKKKKGVSADPKCLILLEIRGQLLYVLNNSASVTLGLTKEPGTLTVPHPDIDPLVWFCTQLQKDIDQHLQHKPDKKAHPQCQVEHEEQVKEVLEQLKAHPQCLVVNFVPSRLLFKIRKKSGPLPVSVVRVVGLNKWMKKQSASHASEDPFQKCLARGLSFLDAPDVDVETGTDSQQ